MGNCNIETVVATATEIINNSKDDSTAERRVKNYIEKSVGKEYADRWVEVNPNKKTNAVSLSIPMEEMDQFDNILLKEVKDTELVAQVEELFPNSAVNLDSLNLDALQVDKSDAQARQASLTYQKAYLERLKARLKAYKLANKGRKTSKDAAARATYQNHILTLNEEIIRVKHEVEQKEEKSLVVNILENLAQIESTLNNQDIDLVASQDIKDRLDFYKQALTGVTMGKDVTAQAWQLGLKTSDLTNMIGQLGSVEALYHHQQENLIQSLIDKDPVIQKRLAEGDINFSEVQDLVQNRADVGFFKGFFMGINGGDDSILRTLIQTVFERKKQDIKSQTRWEESHIIELDSALKDEGYNFENFFEKDSQGGDTGKLTSAYTPEAQMKTLDLNQRMWKVADSIGVEATNRAEDAVGFAKSNFDLIDFRKLSAVQEAYKEKYQEDLIFTAEETAAYEAELQEQLGEAQFNLEVEKILEKLEEYEEYIAAEKHIHNNYTEQNIAKQDPWFFVQNYDAATVTDVSALAQTIKINKTVSVQERGQIHQTSETETVATYNFSRYASFIPKLKLKDIETGEVSDSNFYSEKFKEIAENPTALEYLNTLTKLYTNNINPTYKAMGESVAATAWAKYSKDTMAAIKEATGFKETASAALAKIASEVKDDLALQHGNSNSKKIKAGYKDQTISSKRKLKEALGGLSEVALQSKLDEAGLTVEVPITDVEAFKDAAIEALVQELIYKDLDRDLTKTTLALLSTTNLYKARTQTVYEAQTLFDKHKNIKSKDGSNRIKSNAKIQHWIDTVIYNNPTLDAGKTQRWGPTKKMYSEEDKKLIAILEEVKENNLDNENHRFVLNDYEYKREGDSYTILRVNDANALHENITEEKFIEALEELHEEKLSHIGKELSLFSIYRGIVLTYAKNVLRFNFILGQANRLQGYTVNTITDALGKLWTPGNLTHATKFLTGVNFKLANPKLMSKTSIGQQEQYQQLITTKKLITELEVYQDRKNILDRKDEQTRATRALDLDPYAFSISMAEFHNQAEVVLSCLMDETITDSEGNTYAFFDKTTGEFTAYKPGTLELKDEFKTPENMGWENFTLSTEGIEATAKNNNFFTAKLRIEDSIKRTQGNYSENDTIRVQGSEVGRLLLVFKRYIPEYLNAMFGKQDLDIIQGKRDISGRFRVMARKPFALSAAAVSFAGIAAGPVGVMAMGSVLATAALGYGIKNRKAMTKDLILQQLNLKSNLRLLQEILVQTVDFPLRFFGAPKTVSEILPDSGFYAELTEEDLQGIRSLAAEIAVQITKLSAQYLAYMMLFSDDDDEDDTKRQFYYFLHNNFGSYFDTTQELLNPSTSIENVTRFVALKPIESLVKTLDIGVSIMYKGDKTFGDIGYELASIAPVPIPSAIVKSTGKGMVPWVASEKRYGITTWTEASLNPTKFEKTRLSNLRATLKKEYRDNLKEKNSGRSKKWYDSEARKRMYKKDVARQEGESHKDAYIRLKNNMAKIKKSINK